ncbi:hypothetical protein OG746_04035 [Streptomyces sp. NBC_01016]|uniref:hypothetical protein n=1 Tax=Streptomyces sp. NBC_01016 TaxID=2903720 RepID=UPI00225179CA|nr:hypothetical protein [Streptomyces sp. NBC_01016]MCX4827908.1 hypothetical protein [Streptomyces sp. NBC_01016]
MRQPIAHRWRNVAVTAAWVAVGTAAGALGAWQLAGTDANAGTGSHGHPLDDAAVHRALASAQASTPRADTSSDAPAPADQRRTLRFTGGSATVECGADGSVYLVSWSPSDGYEIDDDDVVRGPGRVARLEAEPSDDDDGPDRHYEIRCAAGSGTPKAVLVPDHDDDDD